MADKLQGKRIAFLVAPEGIEQVELTEPWKAIEERGRHARADLHRRGRDPGLQPPRQGATRSRSTAPSADASASDYDGLVLPGGVANPDFLRTDDDAVGFVRAFFEQAKPVGVICHGPWTLVEADVLRGRTITSWPSLQTDIRNAGGTWVDEEVVVDEGLVSSRNPDDLPAFCAKIVEEFCEGKHEGQRSSVGSAS